MFINFKKLTRNVSAAIFFISKLNALDLSLEEKIGQLLIVTCPSSEVDEVCEKIIDEIHVGGFIYYSWINPLDSKVKLKKLTNDLQKKAKAKPSKLPLFISIDQEGGVVSRLSNDFTLFPGNFAIGKSNSFRLCQKAAEAMAKELKYCGINLNFAPVVDVIDNDTIPYIGFRSFGSDPRKVSRFAKTTLKGFHNMKLLGTLKHYPGHGSAKKDSHVDLPVIEKSFEDLKKNDLYPFEYLKNDTDLIMTAHVLVPCLDPENPVTVSKKAIDYLKETIGFKGLVISDSLTMDGLLKTGYTLEEAAVKSFNAGCDLLLIGGKKLNDGQNSYVSFEDLKHLHQTLLTAVQDGLIQESRLDEAVTKILKYKRSINSNENVENFKRKSHKKISESIAKKAIHAHFRPLKDHMYNHYFLMTSCDMQRKLNKLDKDLDFLSGRIFFDKKNNNALKLIENISHQDLIIFLSQGLKKNNDEEKLFEELIKKNKSVFLIDLSEHEQRLSNAIGIIQTNSPHEASLKLAFNKLRLELKVD